MCCALFASLQTSLHSRHIPRCRPNPSPGLRPRFLPHLGFRGIAALCILRFALLRYRPRDIGVTYPVTDPTPARASVPLFVSAVANFKLEWELLIEMRTCVTRASVTNLRKKIRGASRVTDPQKTHSHINIYIYIHIHIHIYMVGAGRAGRPEHRDWGSYNESFLRVFCLQPEILAMHDSLKAPCAVGAAVPCPGTGSCAGNQCCPDGALEPTLIIHAMSPN